MVVAEAVRHLLLRSIWHEDMCIADIFDITVDITCGRLGTRMDRGQRAAADILRHDAISSHNERHPVLHHRQLHKDEGD